MVNWVCVCFPRLNKLFWFLLVLFLSAQFILSADVLPDVSEGVSIEQVQNQTGENTVAGTSSQKQLGQMPSFENIAENNDDLDINSMQDFFQEMLKIWMDAKKREEERKSLYLAKLSDQHRELLISGQKQYNKFLESVDIRNGLASLCRDVHQGLEQFSKRVAAVPTKGQELIQSNLKTIEKLQTAIELDYCKFLPKRMQGMSSRGIEDLSGVMSGFMQGMMPEGSPLKGFESQEPSENEVDAQEDPELVFDFDEVSGFCESLKQLLGSKIFEVSGLENDEISEFKEKTEYNVGILSDILLAISHKNQQELILCYVTYLEPLFNSTVDTLKLLQKSFEQEVKDYIASQAGNLLEVDSCSPDKEVMQKSYVFWYKEIRKYQRTMLVFSTLKSSASSCVEGTEKLFDIMAYTYDVASCFYDFYKRDLKKKYKDDSWPTYLSHKEVVIPMALDWGFCSGFSAWYFFLKRPDITSGLMLQSILGNMPISMIDVKQTTIFNFMVMPFAAAVLFSPSTWLYQSSYVTRSLGKVAGAWAYYNMMQVKMFGFQKEDRINNYVCDFLIEIEKVLCGHISKAIRNSTDPVLVDKIETWSLGIVRPEAIEYFVQSITPIFLFEQLGESKQSPDNKNWLQRRDQSKFPFSLGIFNEDFLKSKTISGMVTDYENWDQETKNKYGIKAYYMEACVAYYISSCVGKTIGSAITRKIQGPVIDFATYAGGKFLDGLAALHIISQDTREIFSALKEEFNEGVEENIMILKLVLKEGLSPQSPLRNMLVYNLNKRGNINIDSANSEVEINNQVIEYFLDICAKWEYISHLDAILITQEFKEKEVFDDVLIEKIVIALKNNMLARAGGLLGSFAATWAMYGIEKWHGPFGPKIADKFQGCFAK